jgi:hypothetical protein
VPLSQWAEKSVMVAEMSNETASFIWDHMPYARVLQYCTAWLKLKGYQVVPISTANFFRGSLQKIIE